MGQTEKMPPRPSAARPEANDNERVRLVSTEGCPAPKLQNALPSDAAAVVEPVPIATNQSGRARAGEWRLWFKPRQPPTVDPLTGWTGGSDPLANLTLRFPTREAAEGFCRRQGLWFEVRSAPATRSPLAPALAENGEMPFPAMCCWPTGPHAMCCGDYPVARAGANSSVKGRTKSAQEGEGAQ
jgi:hypothetical protein